MIDNFETFFRTYRDRFFSVLKQVKLEEVEQVVSTLIEIREAGQTLFLIGNGGSAASASHFAIDFLQTNRHGPEKPFRVISLTENVPVLTALANDQGYENVFVKQLEPLFREGDALMALTASGRSANVLKAIEFANQQGGVTMGIVGFDGGDLKGLCRYSIHIPTQKGEYGPVEDAFMFLEHLITSYLSGKEQSFR